MAVGSPGGSRIIPYVAKLCWVLEWNMDIQDAINLPNLAKNLNSELEVVPRATKGRVGTMYIVK